MTQTDTSSLLLVPTSFEEQVVKPMLQLDSSVVMELCGFGPVAAGIRASMLIQQYQPERVILIGIAGSLVDSLNVGDGYSFSTVDCYGIGAGTGKEHLSASEMGWSFFKAEASQESKQPKNGIEGELALAPLSSLDTERTNRELLTVCSSAASMEDVAQRLAKHPNALAEDMEAYAVAAACCLHDLPVSVVRGISNVAGDRDKANWQIESAFNAVAEIINPVLKAN